MATKKKTSKKAAAAEGEDTPKTLTKKAPKKKRITKAEREAAEEAARLKEKWEELNQLSEGQASKKYILTSEFPPNTGLDHPKFGWGYVLSSHNNRLEVLFHEGIKVLISNYKES